MVQRPIKRDPDAPQKRRAKPSVLFLCDGNDGYSLVAQSILNHKADSYFHSLCAYTNDNCNIESACRSLRHFNIDCTDKHLDTIEAYSSERIDYLIALSPSSIQSGKRLPRYDKFIPWDITEGGELTEQRQIIKYINDQINYFLSVYLYR
ncbi:hypothetical protein LRP49_18215 [Enterovibrio sp. ZSDZ35]|uniref:Protein-tyrosine-phosphatase n=1 Tax=Enterovibrio qingdaonensis TaxID=2899818 RepID=A0ABT5QQ51_9GAMM|nr:hypothetical protein [Enterovibrio sp. ZSDZ35]MDD1783107.1 hypothetical protein [Enterovibrio sp. ZSDZ35]